MVKISKDEIVATLHARGQDTSADWADAALPDILESDENHQLLETLGIDVATMSPIDSDQESDRAGSPPSDKGR